MTLETSPGWVDTWYLPLTIFSDSPDFFTEQEVRMNIANHGCNLFGMKHTLLDMDISINL